MEYLANIKAKQDAIVRQYKKLSDELKGKSSAELEALHEELMESSALLNKALKLQGTNISDADIAALYCGPLPVAKVNPKKK